MTAHTPKGIPFPENGIDYYVDTAEQIQAVAERVDELFDGYRPLAPGGLSWRTKILEADTTPIGTAETPVLTSEQFVLDEPTQVQITFSWDALTATQLANARFRLRPGNLNGDPLGGTRVDLPANRPAGGGSTTCCPMLPAGTYTILATLQLDIGEAVLHASQGAPATLLVRPLP